MVAPLSPGSVCLGLHVHDLPATAAIEHLLREAAQAEAAGFDGLGLSEHHFARRGYLPSPIQAASWLLARTSSPWVGICPTLLLLRHPRLVAEEIAWLHAAHPGRVALGVAPGNDPAEFPIVDADADDLARRFEASLHALVDALAGRDPIVASDRAIRDGHGHLPVVSGLASVTAAKRAARAGVGLLFGPAVPWDFFHRMLTPYRELGGTGPMAMIKRVWVGDDPPLAAVREEVGTGADYLIHGSPEAVADELRTITEHAPEMSFNLRVHHPGVSPDAAREQIDLLGAKVLPLLRG